MSGEALDTAKRSKPGQDRAKQLAQWLDYELKKHRAADEFALTGRRKTWELMRLALRKYAQQ
jgi:hypothetical protein